MTERTIFECDVTGERFGAKNDVLEIGVKRRPAHSPFDIHEYDLHLSDEALDDAPYHITGLKYVTVEAGEILGCGVSMKSDSYSRDRHVQYYDRDDVVVEHYEDSFAWLEEELL